jgi:hypothetical protein
MNSCAFDGSIDWLCAGRLIARKNTIVKIDTRTDWRPAGIFGETKRIVFEASAMFEFWICSEHVSG